MLKYVKAQPSQDEGEERTVRKLAQSYHAPADWKFYAQMVVESWAGKTPNEIASKLNCHPQTVRIHLARFNMQGVDGLGMRAGSGRKPRLTEQECGKILASKHLWSTVVVMTRSGSLEPCGSVTAKK